MLFGTKHGSRDTTDRGILTYRSKQAAVAADPLAPLWPQPPVEQAVWYLVNTRLEELAVVQESDVEKYGLRVGDVVTLKNGRVVNPPSIGRPDYGDLTQVTAAYPEWPIWLTNPTLASKPKIFNTLRAIEAAVGRIGYGQRLAVLASPEAGKTSAIEALMEAVLADRSTFPQGRAPIIIGLFVGERPEEIQLLSRPDIEVHAKPGDAPSEEIVKSAFLCLERAKRLMEAGRDVVLLIDSLTRFGRYLNQAYKPSKDENPGQGGYFQKPLDILNRFFMAARRLESGGSLTIIGTGLIETGDKGDERISTMIASASNASIVLRGKAAAGSRAPNLTAVGFPAIDIAGSTTRMVERMRKHQVYAQDGLTAEEAFDLNLEYARMLRGIAAGEGGPVAALERLLTDIRIHPKNMDMYRQGAGERRTQQVQELKQPLNEILNTIEQLDPGRLIDWLKGRMTAMAKKAGVRGVQELLAFLEEWQGELREWVARQDEEDPAPRRPRGSRRT